MHDDPKQSHSVRRAPTVENYAPLRREELQDPYPTWERVRGGTPVFFNEELGMWSVTSYDAVQAVLRDTRTFSSSAAFAIRESAVPQEIRQRLPENFFQPRTLVTMDPPAHTERRRVVQRAFLNARIASLMPLVRDLSERLIDRCRDLATLDLMAEFAYPLPLKVIRMLLGFHADDEPALRQWTEDRLKLISATRAGHASVSDDDAIASLSRMADTFDAARGLIAERRVHPADDLASALIGAAQAERLALPDDEIVGELLALVVAGNDTTANLVGHLVRYCLEERRLWEELLADRDLIPVAVEEALRHRGSSKGLFRVATQDVNFFGAQIRQGDTLHVLFAAANHDSLYFACPHKFALHRDDSAPHVAFGKGTHFCIGAPLARLEATVALGVLLDELPNMTIVVDQEFEYIPALTTQTLKSLEVNSGFLPRSALPNAP